ncbi:NAD(P)/FAD-dependent oxidoreductase [Kibdelosporangium phytohabitans]|uniref:Thioredoxin reductase n=1 Tax=Kibdelosporangium phytohabitans TaxID=860235 RepID=A0A0N9I6G2_9PSEU|nr:NAD(P)/FAD-dependent oxidoreductase [Kibdelosporangium phytohabitans]ALG10340.1 thioredoxin reductase [Kibdelosporangium phytohabitans]MBE1461385.1 thioredoxin reductase [Kibdelosporangium phytohabitans]
MVEQQNSYDVVVIGGGAAGLSGALVLARARRSIVVIDSGSPRFTPAANIHGLLAQDGITPAEWLERGRSDVVRHGGRIAHGTVEAVTGGTEFAVTLADYRTIFARRLLVASGLTDELPDIPGLGERWGRDVLHCPYCHGWEVRDQAIGVLATGPLSAHQALLLRQWSDDVTFFSHGTPFLSEDDRERFAARGIRVVDGDVMSLEVVDDRLAGVRLADGAVVSREALVVSPRMVARARFLSGLGLHPVDHPAGAGQYIPSDSTGRTEVPGIWVAGNVTDLAAQVAGATAAGAVAAAQINADLVDEETHLALVSG